MKKTLLLFLLIGLSFGMKAQKFLPPIDRFTEEKTGFLVLNSGEKIEFRVDRIKRKKGLIVNIKGFTLDHKKLNYKADEIKEMGIPPSGWSKLMATLDATESAVTTVKTDVKELNRELVYFYQEYITDRKRTALLQLINPTFYRKMRVYDNPWASETSGIKLSGIQMTGGVDKSYYVNYKGKTARIYKRDYDHLFKEYFGDCPALLAKFPNGAWRDFPDHLYFYEQNCMK